MKTFNPTKKIINNTKTIISIRISTKKIDKIDEIAGKIDISRNELINQCIDYALENINNSEA